MGHMYDKEDENMIGKSKSSSAETEAKVKVGTVLGAGAVFEGDLTAPEAIRIDGTINGNCTCEKEVVIGKNGQVTGTRDYLKDTWPRWAGEP